MRARLVAVLLLLGVNAAGCGEDECPVCSPCPHWGALTVEDAVSSGPVPGATVVGASVTWTCADSGGVTRCTTAEQLPVEPVSLEVAAPGYASKAVVLTPAGGEIDACGCASCVTYSPSTVALARAP
ncbi:hypothetical protein ACOQFB_16220 [Anaeromyxobacter sp. Red801]|uniref:hypothetical protein n=1 Tax=Anaeromyxobacter sp. Red801 TaxID=3411632 RepID=UPI003BA2745F